MSLTVIVLGIFGILILLLSLYIGLFLDVGPVWEEHGKKTHLWSIEADKKKAIVASGLGILAMALLIIATLLYH